MIKAPKIEKKAPVILSVEEVNSLLSQPSGKNAKEIRDKAMLELLYATGIRVSELIGLKVSDVNLSVDFITCRDGEKERMIPFGKVAKNSLMDYMERARDFMLKGQESPWLFTNCNGKAMSRQGFWKIINIMERKPVYRPTSPPPTRCAIPFAAHLLKNGADIHAVQAMLGHSDMATTQMYAAYSQNDRVRDAYTMAHPRR